MCTALRHSIVTVLFSLSLSLCLSFSLPPVASRSRGSSSARQRIVTIQAAILGFGFGLCGHVGVIIQRQVPLRLSGVRVQGFRVFALTLSAVWRVHIRALHPRLWMHRKEANVAP